MPQEPPRTDERPRSPQPYDKTRERTRQTVEDSERTPGGIAPTDADPNYGPPDPDDPQRSGT